MSKSNVCRNCGQQFDFPDFEKSQDTCVIESQLCSDCVILYKHIHDNAVICSYLQPQEKMSINDFSVMQHEQIKSSELIEKNFHKDLSLYVLLFVQCTSSKTEKFLVEFKFPLLTSIKCCSMFTNKITFYHTYRYMYNLDSTKHNDIQNGKIIYAHVQRSDLRQDSKFLKLDTSCFESDICTKMESVKARPARCVFVGNESTPFYYFVDEELL